jgi:hypothetical protein
MIARTRKRPRRESCSFRTLGWLIHRTAAWHAIHGPSSPASYPALARPFVRTQRVPLTYKARRHLALALPWVIR